MTQVEYLEYMGRQLRLTMRKDYRMYVKDWKKRLLDMVVTDRGVRTEKSWNMY